MAARGRGGGKTPERVVKLLQEAVKESSQTAVAKATGQTRLTIQRYLQGIGEPSQSTLEKLSDYFKLPVWELRGDVLQWRTFGQEEYDDTRVNFDLQLKYLKDFIELYSLSPEHLKQTVVDSIYSELISIESMFEVYTSEFSKNDIKKINKIMTEARNIVGE